MVLRVCLMLALTALANAARGDVIFSLASFNGATATNSFNLGDTVTMRLIATGSDVGPSPWEGFNAVITASTATPNSAAAASTPMFAFNVSNTLAFDGSGRTIGGAALAPVASASGDVLGTFSFTASAPGPITFGFNASSLINNTAEFVTPVTPFNTGNGLSLVGTTISVVPEPSSFALLGMVSIGLAGYRRRTASTGSLAA